jgi:selenocysteine-specific elongation factor
VDHGKTALIQALTGIDTDRLPEEKERGLTIDLGFAHLDLPNGERVSIVDVPGHAKFTANMLIGAMGMDMALLCIAADEGISEQTKEHAEIIRLLAVPKLIIVITKADLLDSTELLERTQEVEEWLAEIGLGCDKIVATSAREGDGIENLKLVIAEHLPDVKPEDNENWLLPIDRSFQVDGVGTVVTGTLLHGKVSKDDEVQIEPGEITTRVRSLESHGEKVDSSNARARTAMNLAGVSVDDAARGKLAGTPGTVFASNTFDVRLRLAEPITHGQRVRISIGAEEIVGSAFQNEHDPNLFQIHIRDPIGCARGMPVIIRNASPQELLAGGKVEVPLAERRRKGARVVSIEPDLSPQETALAYIGQSEGGAYTFRVAKTMGLTEFAAKQVLGELVRSKQLIGFGDLWFTGETLKTSIKQFVSTLQEMHTARPDQLWISRADVMKNAGLGWKDRSYDKLLELMVKKEWVVVKGTSVRLATHQLQLNTKQQDLLNRLMEIMNTSGLTSLSKTDLAHELKVPPQAIDEVLRLGLESGLILHIGSGIYYPVQVVEQAKEKLLEKFSYDPFTTAQAKEVLGTSRKHLIPLLEYFDSIRYTFRNVDERRISRPSTARTGKFDPRRKGRPR